MIKSSPYYPYRKESLRLRAQTEYRLVAANGGGERSGLDWEFGHSRCKLLHLKWTSNEVLLHSTGNYTQSLEIDHDGRDNVRKGIYV